MSISQSSLFIFQHDVDFVSSCFIFHNNHLPKFRSVLLRNDGHVFCIACMMSLAVRFRWILKGLISIISPVSNHASIFMIVMPVWVSLFNNTDCMGDAQRYLGNMEPWTFIGESLAMSSMFWGIIFQYAITTMKSGFCRFSRFSNLAASSLCFLLSFLSDIGVCMGSEMVSIISISSSKYS